METIVRLSESAFHTILFSAFETYPYPHLETLPVKEHGEVVGLLFGNSFTRTLPNNNEYLMVDVKFAIPTQIVINRSKNEVIYSSEKVQQMVIDIQRHPCFCYIGGYHSHPYMKDEYSKIKRPHMPSEADFQTSIGLAKKFKNNNPVEIIIALAKKQNQSKTGVPEVTNYYISNYWGEYKYKMACFTADISRDTSSEVFDRPNKFICEACAGIWPIDLQGTYWPSD